MAARTPGKVRSDTCTDLKVPIDGSIVAYSDYNVKFTLKEVKISDPCNF